MTLSTYVLDWKLQSLASFEQTSTLCFRQAISVPSGAHLNMLRLLTQVGLIGVKLAN